MIPKINFARVAFILLCWGSCWQTHRIHNSSSIVVADADDAGDAGDGCSKDIFDGE